MPSPKVTEREIVPNGIDPLKHWQDEIANAPDTDLGRIWVEVCRGQIKRLEKSK